jgi:hypothetical protein
VSETSEKPAPLVGLAEAMAASPAVFIVLFVGSVTAVFVVPIARYVVSHLVSPPPGFSRAGVIGPILMLGLLFAIEAVCYRVLRGEAERTGGGAYGVLGHVVRTYRTLRATDRVVVVVAVAAILMCLFAFALA